MQKTSAARAQAVAAFGLGLIGALTLAAGLVHSFLPDGGAGVIAGIDLSANGETILRVFRWMGAMQIAHGLALIIVALRYRSLVSLFLALAFLERGLMALDAWMLSAAPDHRPPEHYASLIALPVILVLFLLSLRAGAAGTKVGARI
jgi:hypothetical protein